MHPRGDLERYLAEGLPADAERRLREHLRGCAECRRRYDEELVLRRALAGSPTQPTAAEEARLRRQILTRAGLAAPVAAPARAPRPLAARPWRLALPVAAAGLAVLLGLWLVRPRPVGSPPPRLPSSGDLPSVPSAPLAVARLLQARDATVAGVPARSGESVLPAAEVRVGSDGLAELALARGGRVRLFAGTRLKLRPGGEAIDLTAGKVWCEVEPGHGRFIVATERGEVRVLGTSFIVEAAAGGDTDVRVVSGTVEVEDVGHRGSVRVRDGQRTRLMSGAPPARVQRYEAQSDRQDWEQALRGLGRALQRGLRRLGEKLHLP